MPPLQGSSNINLNTARLGNQGAIYWLGANGNIYLKGAGGNTAPVRDLGPGSQQLANSLILSGASQIADPNPPAAGGGGGGTASVAPSGGGGSAPARPDRSNSIQLQEAGLAALGDQESSGIAAVNKALQELLGKYTREATANEAQYGKQATTNKQNLQTNQQVAFTQAAQGRRGLFGTLSSLGALSGSGIELANRAVQAGANADLTGAQGTFDENQTALDTNIGLFRRQDEERRRDADTSASDARTGVKNQIAGKRQGFYAQLADDYAQMGDEANSKKFAAMAASLYPELASTSIPSSNLSYTSAAFTPTTLASYLAGGGTTVSTTPAQPGGLPGLVAGSPRKRRETTGVV